MVADWRRGAARPTTGQFRDLVKALQRPESFFFLAQPPTEDDVPPAFRSPPPGTDASMTIRDAAHVRTAKRVQAVSKWLVSRRHRPVANLPSVSTAESPEVVAERVRTWLGWDMLRRRDRGSDAQFAKRVRSDLENRAVLVLHLSMGQDGWRGFSLQSPQVPVVVANTFFNYRPRVFTYLHEVAHLSAATQSICPVRSDAQLERWCDRVAGAVLIPAREVVHVVTTELGVREVVDLEQVRRVANAFTVSLRATAVRLEHLGLAPPGLYDMVHAVAKVREVKRGGGPTGGPPQTRSRVRLQTFGSGYVQPVLDALAGGALTRTDTMELLDVSVDDLPELRTLATTDALAEE